MRRFFAVVAILSLLAMIGCAGDDGATGPAGTSAVDKGTISGTVKDVVGVGIAGVSVNTVPATSTATTAADGSFSLANVPIGAYTVTASGAGYTPGSVAGVSVAAGATSSVSIALSSQPPAAASVTGKVVAITGFSAAPVKNGVAGATVKIVGTTFQATTGADGSYTITGVPTPGPYFIDVTAPTGYVEGGTKESFFLSAATNAVPDIALSARPSDTASWTGRLICSLCHSAIATAHQSSAHWLSLTPDKSRMVDVNLWPAVGATVNPGLTGQDPANPAGLQVPFYLCQNTAGAYAVKFGGTADCGVADGTLVPVSGTYGGEGDGGIDNTANVGKYKQRYFAKLADVPSASGWAYTSGKDKDYLILPVQITQSGDGAPKFAGYHGNDWLVQGRTFSRACAGCHSTGMTVAWDNNTLVTSFNYIDLNISCERCHGPGSEHFAAGGGLGKSIINPRLLSPDKERQTCGQCHAADAGKSKDPNLAFGFGFNAGNASKVGKGFYVPGVYDIADYIGNLATGGFDKWPDGKHGKAHRQQYTELVNSIHANNPFERMTCADCHNVHSLKQGPTLAVSKDSAGNNYGFSGLKFKNNTDCLRCHATYGPFASLTKGDIAALNASYGGTTTLNGAPISVDNTAIAAAKAKVGKTVVDHMNEAASMGLFVVYNVDTEPGVGRCMNCHMPQTGKSGGYTTGKDQFGGTALVEGDESSHAFDIIAPQVSKEMVPSAGGDDTKVMPNSCGKCHERYRYSAN
ncbi:MAG TPA: carboxypeptidase regulatory-like domain-containing protein [Anaerolineales bacterium]|nr:carboxypeptidase regulatory-like domain-containing protein [Anaerolineales bacterium]